MKNICVLGSTGSIGTQALDVVEKNPEKFNISVLTCNRSVDKLIPQIEKFKPDLVAVGDEEGRRKVKERFPHLDVLTGEDGIAKAAETGCDIVLNSLLGISGLVPTIHAIKAGSDIAFANKETLVAGGETVMGLVKEKGVKMLPVDSEHSAIFQCLEGERDNEIRRILLTASGGPFRGYTRAELEKVTLENALNHPNWKMGKKITIDSATLMNKGFEVIEARWLFDVAPDDIEVVVHPESIIHSAVEFMDTSVIAQMGKPDMRLPIAYAFNYPERIDAGLEPMDLTALSGLHFEKPDRETFKCLDMAYEALKEGGTYTAALNGANEVLVSEFLKGNIKFTDIPDTIKKVLDEHISVSHPDLETVLEADRITREKTYEYI